MLRYRDAHTGRVLYVLLIYIRDAPMLHPTLIDHDEELMFGFPSEDLKGRIIRHDEGHLWLGDVQYRTLEAFGVLMATIMDNGYGIIVPASNREMFLLCERFGLTPTDINDVPCFIG